MDSAFCEPRTKISLFGNIPPVSGKFYREKLIEEVNRTFETGYSPLVLYSPGGMGKTRCAIEFQEKYRHNYGLIVWISAGENLEFSYQEFAIKLLGKEAEKMTQNKQIKEVNFVLNNNDMYKNDSVLFIFDNVNNQSNINPYLKALPVAYNRKIHVLLTTQNQEILTLHKKFEIVSFTDNDVKNYIEDSLPGRIIKDTDIKRLMEITDNHPLSLSYLMAYIDTKNKPFDEFFEEYREDDIKLLEEIRFDSEKDESIKPWQVMLSRIRQVREENKLAGEILDVCAFLAPDAISENIINSYFNACYDRTNKKKIKATLNILKGYSLVNDNKRTPGYLYTHRFLQKVLRYQIKQNVDDYQNLGRNLLNFFEKSTLKDYEETMSSNSKEEIKEYSRQLFMHAQIVFEYIDYKLLAVEIRKNYASMLLLLGRLFIWHADYYKAKIKCKYALGVYKTIYKEAAHKDIENIFVNLGNIYSELGKYPKAKKYLEQALAIYDTVYGTVEHPDVVRALHILGAVFGMDGEMPKAKEYLEKALKMGRIVYGQENAHLAMSDILNDLGNVYAATKKYSKACAFYNEALTKHLVIIYPDEKHLAIASIYHNLGDVFRDLCDYDNALKYLSKALEIKCAIYPDKKHPCVARTLNDLGEIFFAQNDLNNAKSCFSDAIEIYEAIYGRDAPKDVVITLRNLKNVIDKQKEKSVVTNGNAYDFWQTYRLPILLGMTTATAIAFTTIFSLCSSSFFAQDGEEACDVELEEYNLCHRCTIL